MSRLSQIILPIALLSHPALANNFNYNTFELRAASGTNTFGGEVYLPITNNSHIITRLDSHLNNDWDAAAGVGFNGPVSPFLDLYGQLLAHHVNPEDLENPPEGYDEESDVYGEINLGGRLWLTPQVEVVGHYARLVDDEDNRSAYTVGARFHSTQQLSFGLDWKHYQVYEHQIAFAVRFAYR
ncbi:hypothetical protein [Vibrio maerlii]|uniref:hypothetical protein n=1 Tax=Vibrio maerlii TaxID=2231648 RepID=UPI000E3E5786|nr:hypothetical protein [Vibrio maerlii]